MLPDETATEQHRRYIVVGFLIGWIIALVTREVLALRGGWVILGWGMSLGGIGALVAWLIGVGQREDDQMPARKPRRSGSVDSVASDDRDPISSTVRVLAVTPDASTADLRPMRIQSEGGQLSSPDVELNVLIEDYDYTVRVPVLERVLERLTSKEVAQRVLEEVTLHRPKTTKEPDFEVVSYRSEGPVYEDGRCLYGWTFSFVDGRVGLGCTAVATQVDILLHYHTAPTHFRSQASDWTDPADARRILLEEVPALEDADLYLRVGLPVDIWLYRRDPLIVADVDVAGGAVRNAAALNRMLDNPMPARDERFVLDDVRSFLAAREDVEYSPAFTAAIEASAFADGLRTLRDGALYRTATALAAEHGPPLAATLEEEIRGSDLPEEQEALVQILARIPNGLSLVMLHRLARSKDELGVRQSAEQLFDARIRGELEVPGDPIAAQSFTSARAAMGKEGLTAVPLMSTYAPEDDLLEPLSEIGLTMTRARYLSGPSDLLLSAYFRPTRGDTEAILTSTPIPVPCHILHLVGSSAEVFRQRVEKAGVTYSLEDIYEDAATGSPTRVHRACLYLAALGVANPSGSEPLLEGYRKGRRDKNLRRAVIRALGYVPDKEAAAFLETTSADPESEEADLARAVLQARIARAVSVDPQLAETKPASEPGSGGAE